MNFQEIRKGFAHQTERRINNEQRNFSNLVKWHKSCPQSLSPVKTKWDLRISHPHSYFLGCNEVQLTATAVASGEHPC